MPSNAEREKGIGYPGLSKDQIDLIIDSLLCTVRDRDLRGRLDEAELTIGKLTDFYTRRWGLPPAITRRSAALREQLAGRG